MHEREILGMAKSPWDKTFYIDADCEVAHEDLPTVFDKFEGNDLLFSHISPMIVLTAMQNSIFFGGRFEWCGGTCLYDSSNPLVMEFMNDWYELTKAQYNGLWWPKNEKGEEDVYATP